MQPIEVTARFSADGEVTPLSFFFEQRHYPVTSIGRRWRHGDELHVLVMSAEDEVFELVFLAAETRWWLGYRTPREAYA